MIFRDFLRGLLAFMVVLLISDLVVAEPCISKVGSQKVTEDDLVYLLSRRMDSDLDVAALAWMGMDSKQRKNFVSHVEDVLFLSEASRLKGLGLNRDVVRKIRWDGINTLAKAYVDRISLTWDLSEEALREFYSSNGERYRAPEKVLAEVRYSGDLDDCDIEMGEPRWFSLNDVPDALKEFFFVDLKLGDVPPVRSSDGGLWMARVLEFQGSRILPFDVVEDRVKEDLKGAYLEEELRRLRGRILPID
ncbi:peptidyl-prolyl cis-trans isomerase [Dethiosulfovibrio sp. F2B]|uniref:peptidylprolyl isomerase n=1 Tax=Dethiosulfovibrio faecalis TaxID=2720018 RepID=UPI001F22EB18|nr:peptidylprolyl isomerase [Dethiosulfovibrio faecalis]MCF4151125.1 peptidyl-prolyl cis-trans isomerase [Dethiosulfovibrio faecalis]